VNECEKNQSTYGCWDASIMVMFRQALLAATSAAADALRAAVAPLSRTFAAADGARG
jgi:hypothetical protein